MFLNNSSTYSKRENMKQTPVQQFESKCGRCKLFVENDMEIGIFHDFLMELKGLMVERMVNAHKEQMQQLEAQKQQDPEMQTCSQDDECASKGA